MIALVTGGAASGKSAFAEALACSLSPIRTYLATMAWGGAEAEARIAKHRAQRADAGFATVEPAGTLVCDAPSAQATSGVVLLDDVGNLVSRALFDDEWHMVDADQVLNRLDAEFDNLANQYKHVVVVGNEVGHDGQTFSDESGTWVRVVGALCCRIAARCDCVVEVSAGLPLVVKGGLDAVGQSAQGVCA